MEIRANSVLPARREDIELHTADGLTLVGELARPIDHRGDESDRRHWHTGCWRARDRRGPGVERSRNAPRYG